LTFRKSGRDVQSSSPAAIPTISYAFFIRTIGNSYFVLMSFVRETHFRVAIVSILNWTERTLDAINTEHARRNTLQHEGDLPKKEERGV
jgi:hypothetical protein